MKLLVTGLSGFTGIHFAQSARQAGLAVTGLTADITDEQALHNEIQSLCPEVVVHLAGISFAAHRDAAEIYRVNTVGTRKLLTALAELAVPPKKILLASSASVYGNIEASPITETQAPAPISHYAASKLSMEHLAHAFDDRLPIVTVRPFNYTGPQQDRLFLVPKLVEHFVHRQSPLRLGNLNIRREFNDVRMVCEAYLKLIELGLPGQTYNVCTGVSYPLSQLIETLAAMTGFSPEITIDPALVRRDEAHDLRGDPTRLHSVTGPLPAYTLSETLRWMVEVAQQPSHG
jgi:nucleoside-diphosphate-sugar epimerase